MATVFPDGELGRRPGVGPARFAFAAVPPRAHRRMATAGPADTATPHESGVAPRAFTGRAPYARPRNTIDPAGARAGRGDSDNDTVPVPDGDFRRPTGDVLG